MAALVMEAAPTLRVGDLDVSEAERTATLAGRPLPLTPTEFRLLACLARNAGRPVSRSAILLQVWNVSFGVSTNLVDVYINYLRKRLAAAPSVCSIRTVRGVGYELDSRVNR